VNDRIAELKTQCIVREQRGTNAFNSYMVNRFDTEKFAKLIVREMCGLMEQAEDDCYHCFDASERPTEYIEWLRDWQERFEKHFGVEE
jgi:hypothetical protein